MIRMGYSKMLNYLRKWVINIYYCRMYHCGKWVINIGVHKLLHYPEKWVINIGVHRLLNHPGKWVINYILSFWKCDVFQVI